MPVELSALDLLAGAGDVGTFAIAAAFWLHEMRIRWHHERMRRLEKKVFPDYFTDME